MGRPKKDINWELVEKRMEAGCSAKEIAGALHCNMDTFYDRFKEEYGSGFSDFYDKMYEGGNANLRFTQYMKALSGNTNMLTLLGRERLSQGQFQETIPTNDDILTVKHENMILRAQIQTYRDKYHADKPEAG